MTNCMEFGTRFRVTVILFHIVLRYSIQVNTCLCFWFMKLDGILTGDP